MASRLRLIGILPGAVPGQRTGSGGGVVMLYCCETCAQAPSAIGRNSTAALRAQFRNADMITLTRYSYRDIRPAT